MSRTPQSKPPQRMASRVLGFCADNAVAGEFMNFSTEECTKEFRGRKKRFGRSQPLRSWRKTRISSQYVDALQQKKAYDRQKVCRHGRRCARLCAARRNTCLASSGVAHVLSLLSPLRWLP